MSIDGYKINSFVSVQGSDVRYKVWMWKFSYFTNCRWWCSITSCFNGSKPIQTFLNSHLEFGIIRQFFRAEKSSFLRQNCKLHQKVLLYITNFHASVFLCECVYIMISFCCLSIESTSFNIRGHIFLYIYKNRIHPFKWIFYLKLNI